VKRLAWLLALVLAGCSGEAGKAGAPAAACSAAVADDGTITVECPDGSSATLPPGSCEEIADDAGTRTIRCPDGTEAVVQPGEELSEGVVFGRVLVLPARTGAEGALVEVVGTDRSTTCGPDGSFRIEGVPPGNWAIRITHAPWNEVELDPIPFFGAWNVGEILLERGQRFGEPRDLEEETGSMLIRNAFGWAVLRGDGSYLELLDYAEEAWWIGPEAVALGRWSNGHQEAGIWQLDTGDITWWEGYDILGYTWGGILGIRNGEGSLRHFFWLTAEDETEIGSVSSPFWTTYYGKPVFHVYGEEGLFFFDADAGLTLVQLDPRRPSWGTWTDGELLVADFAGERILFDPDGDSYPLPGFYYPDAGLLAWTEHTGEVKIYDGRTNRLRTYPAETPWYFAGPEHRWILTASDGIWSAEPRTGGEPIELGANLPDAWSPEASWAAWIAAEEEELLVVVRNLNAGEAALPLDLGDTVDLEQLNGFWWLDERWLALLVDGRLHLVSVDGVLVDAGVIGGGGIDVEIGDGYALVHDDGTLRLGDLATGEWAVLGRARYATFTPDGSKVVWISHSGRLHAFDLATGKVDTMASRVEDFLLVETGVMAIVPHPMSGDDTVLFLPW